MPVYSQNSIKKLGLFLGTAYLAQGLCQTGALIEQPLNNYLMNSLNLNAAQVAEKTAVLVLPWTIKPLYGLISDFLPLFGYRRKSYLLLTGLLATIAFLGVTGQINGIESVPWVIFALLMTSFGVAFGDVLVDAVMVEQGKETGALDAFQSRQWLCMNAAGVISALVGGLLAQHFSGGMAVRVAAGIVAFAPLTVGVIGWFMIPETRSHANVAQLRATGHGLKEMLKSRELWLVLLFLALWKFSPGFGKPLFAYMSKDLGFSQSFIGSLSALGGVGAILGALVFPRISRGQSERCTLAVAIALSTLTTLSYLLLHDAASAVLLNFATGFFEMLVHLAILGLAARTCAKDAAGFSFAAIMSVLNLAGQGSSILGARLYVDVFHSTLTPLILVSAGATLLAYLILPYLSKGSPSPAEDRA